MEEENEVKLCRLCVKSYDHYINIFDPNGTNGVLIWEVIKDLTMLNVSKEDCLPAIICVGCMLKVVEFKHFKKMCIMSMIKLLEMSTSAGCVEAPSNCVDWRDPVPIATQPYSNTHGNLISKQERSDSVTEEISDVTVMDCTDIGLREGHDTHAGVSSHPSCSKTQSTSPSISLLFDESLNNCTEEDIQSSDDDKDNITIDEPSCQCGEGYLCQGGRDKEINSDNELLPCLWKPSGISGQQKKQRWALKRKLPSADQKIGHVEEVGKYAQIQSKRSREARKVRKSSLDSEAVLRTISEKNGQVIDDLDRAYEQMYYCRYCECEIKFSHVVEIVEHMSLMHAHAGVGSEGKVEDEILLKQSEVNLEFKNYVCSFCKTSFHNGSSLARHLMWTKRRGCYHVGNDKGNETGSNPDTSYRAKVKLGNNVRNVIGESATVSNQSFESLSSLGSGEPCCQSGLMYGNVKLKECRVILRDVMKDIRKDGSANVNKELLPESCNAYNLGRNKTSVDEAGVSAKVLCRSKIVEHASHESNKSSVIYTGNGSGREVIPRMECEGFSEIQEFCCDHCKSTFTEKSTLESHMLLVHLQKPGEHVNSKVLKETEKSVLVWRSKYFFCDVCVASFISKTALKHHIVKNHLENVHYTCSKCFVTFESSSRLWRHLATHPQRNGHYICSNCSVIFSSKPTLVSHIIDEHGGVRAVICERCRKGYCSEENFSKHMCTSMLRNTLCRNCGKTNPCGRRREHELMCHLDLKEYMCRICCDLFGNKYYYKQHLRVHFYKKTFACKQCPAKYKCLSSLNEHVKAMHGKDKCTVCNLCGKRFSHARGLRRHERLHSDERLF